MAGLHGLSMLVPVSGERLHWGSTNGVHFGGSVQYQSLNIFLATTHQLIPSGVLRVMAHIGGMPTRKRGRARRPPQPYRHRQTTPAL
ncbi:hypothetical protein ASPACDRAFT_126303 [Aspergillus aculeatus ATCC 16872]|uniref:Uncharacterized protein n=1 Tax=Aspergillus aculeatus (strain ATCC 16872 / CBS 172.66 / WB 5094) TaxID=690307 RepID=A0A1L9WIU5_ASPA1|nr:uncharacterized protein ASPACDRAFT_126303 [Aspergillus aculeatus ATCC 16872]OJJ96035.1 hypothetical protein ASPACDRAFT_126303 [Aspergillus aculeatus ATCC 16872]